LYNVVNALAAIGGALACGLDLMEIAQALRSYQGVARRFQLVGRPRGVEIIDDFAHNPAKIAAALATARLRGARILALFQPHGYGPTRFIRDELIATFTSALTPEDRLYMPEIYYAGGTAIRDISSRDLVREVAEAGIPAFYAERREELIPLLAEEARAGDVILVMGARDPSLTGFCRRLAARLELP